MWQSHPLLPILHLPSHQHHPLRLSISNNHCVAGDGVAPTDPYRRDSIPELSRRGRSERRSGRSDGHYAYDGGHSVLLSLSFPILPPLSLFLPCTPPSFLSYFPILPPPFLYSSLLSFSFPILLPLSCLSPSPLFSVLLLSPSIFPLRRRERQHGK